MTLGQIQDKIFDSCWLLENNKMHLSDRTFNKEVLIPVPEYKKCKIGFGLDD